MKRLRMHILYKQMKLSWKNATNSMIPIIWYFERERRERGDGKQIRAAGLGEVGMGSWNIEIQRLSLGHCEGGHTSSYIFQQAEHTGPRMNSHRNGGAWIMMCKWGNGYCNRRTTPELGVLNSWEASGESRGRRCVKNLCTFQLCCGSETVYSIL